MRNTTSSLSLSVHLNKELWFRIYNTLFTLVVTILIILMIIQADMEHIAGVIICVSLAGIAVMFACLFLYIDVTLTPEQCDTFIKNLKEATGETGQPVPLQKKGTASYFPAMLIFTENPHVVTIQNHYDDPRAFLLIMQGGNVRIYTGERVATFC